jgi:hypothetical protein
MCAALVPDRPVPFGYKQMWLALWDAEPSALAGALGLADVRPATWKEGIERSYESGYDATRRVWRKWLEIFVSPPVRGWTLVVGGIGAFPPIEHAEGVDRLRDLSTRFGHVQHFGTHRVSSYVAWAKARDGRVERAFAWADETLLDFGERTPEEVELGFDFLDDRRATPAEIEAHAAKEEAEFARMRAIRAELNALRAEAEARGEKLDESVYDDPRFAPRSALLDPEEDSVMMLAARWSLDPTQLDQCGLEPGLGLLGSIGRREQIKLSKAEPASRKSWWPWSK